MDRTEEKIRSSFSVITPDIWESIEEEILEIKQNGEYCENSYTDAAGQAETLIPERETEYRTVKKRRKAFTGQMMAVAAALVILLGGGGFFEFKTGFAVDSIIALDVNPSVEIRTNSRDKVLEVVPLNEDGKMLLGTMEFRGNSLEVTINAIIGSMVRMGYIDELKNSILVTVENKNSEKSSRLTDELTDEIQAMLKTDGFSGAVICQTATENSELREKAEEYGISFGKAQLIKAITDQSGRYVFEDLTELTINELNLISRNNSIELTDARTSGEASSKGYIGEAEALRIAMEYSGQDEYSVSDLEVEIDYEKGVMVYEIEFECGIMEYEYDVDAITGEIVRCEAEWDD